MVKKISLRYAWELNIPQLRRFQYNLRVNNRAGEICCDSYSDMFKQSQKNNRIPALSLAMEYLRAHPHEIVEINEEMTKLHPTLTCKLRHDLGKLVEVHNYGANEHQKKIKKY